ncbi:MAG: ROK family protein [Ilumatobacteraceae bacterium]|nr:ROK family protein [Ilumatobacteraceae bacterium]
MFENDVNLAAIGELARGTGRGVRDFVLVSIGTGLGMGVVLDGRLHRGASGLAGEVGYLPTVGSERVETATELVILGGGIGIGTGAGPLLLEPLRRNLAAISPLQPRLGSSELGSAAVVDGAVTEALRLVVDRIFDVDRPSAPLVSAQGARR